MKVSIITSCYNRAATIRDAVESVLAQDYNDIEYIVIDGASSDGTLAILEEYRDRIDILVSEPDGGMYEAINKGIRLATGDIIGLLHSDDVFFDRRTVSDIVSRFAKTGADLVYGDGIFVRPDAPQKVVRNWISGSYARWKVRFGWLPLHPTVYIRRECFEKYGLYDESFRISADSDFLVRYLYLAKLRISYLRRYIVRMRMGGASTDVSKSRLKWSEDIRLFRKHGFNPYIALAGKISSKIPQFITARKAQ